MRLDTIISKAITADTQLMKAVGNRVKSTCFEVSPDKQDNTQLPYIIIIDEGRMPSSSTKDDGWMPACWEVTASVEVCGRSKNEVDALVDLSMKAIANYVEQLSDAGQQVPVLNAEYPQTQGVLWDWTKPCYFDTVRYQCDIDRNYE